MKKLLAILGSPRRMGNSELMAKEIGRHLTPTHALSLLRLPEYHLAPCRGCYVCLFKGRCPIDDDYGTVRDAILEADALILAAPTYFLGPNACLKCFTDRGLALYPHIEALWGKPAVAVGIAGLPGKEGYTLLGLENFLTLLFADIRASCMVYGALPGEILFNRQNMETARSLATALIDTPSPDTGPRCPLCGGRTFRFLSHGRVRCMLCSNAGTLETREGEIQLHIQRSDHELFLTRQEALAHRDWLLSMKARFRAQKDRLKAVSSDYRRDGTWINPASKVHD